MTDFPVIASFAASSLLEISKQERALGEGLLVAAPGDKSGTPNNSVQYLLAGSDLLVEIAQQCTALYNSPSS